MGLNPELVKMALHRVKRADLGGTDQQAGAEAGAGADAFEDLATKRETPKRRVRHNLGEPSATAAAPAPAAAPTPPSVPEAAGVAVNREIPQRIRRYGPTQTAEKLIPPKINMEALHIPGEPGLLHQGWNLARRYPGRAGLIGAGLLAGGYGLGRLLGGGGEPKTACDRLWETLHRRKQAGAVILPLPVRW